MHKIQTPLIAHPLTCQEAPVSPFPVHANRGYRLLQGVHPFLARSYWKIGYRMNL